MKESATYFWLIPAEAERELFRDIIRILAKQFNAPRFEPHLTLCRVADRDRPDKALRKIQSKSIRLRIRGIAQSAKFTKTLFVRVAPDKTLQQLVTALGGDPESLTDPHVSLLYKRLPPAMRRELGAAIELPFREITFDQVKAIRTRIPVKTRKDVESWRVVATKRLRALPRR